MDNESLRKQHIFVSSFLMPTGLKSVCWAMYKTIPVSNIKL